MGSGQQLSDDVLGRLEKLARLKDGGVLSETEFEDAKRKLLAAELHSATPAGTLRNSTKLWIFGGAAALLLGALTAYAVKSDVEVANAVVPDEATDLNVEVAGLGEEPDFEQLCGAELTYSTIKDIVFDKAVEAYGETPGPLNSLRKAVRLRMEVPAMTKIDREIRRVDCSGRAVIDLPPGVQEQFGGKRSISAEVEYSVQPAADGSGSVVSVSGAGGMMASLVGAANLASASQLAAAGGPQLQKTFNPSFDCGQRLSNVERIICQSESLSGYDRALSDRYFEIKRTVSRVEWQTALASQREFLTARAKCPDEACIRNVYVAQSNRLDAIVAPSGI
jgi:hypothetical protein